MNESRSAYAADHIEVANHAGVSWRAVFAGAVGAAALSLILILLGIGLGFSVVSPWSDSGASAQTLGISAILWLALTQIAAAGLGGYLAGRLRVRWGDLQRDEVFFRDTAHGFLAWSVATLLTATLVLSSAGSVVSGGAKAGATVAAGAAGGAASLVGGGIALADEGSLDYYVDALFRTEGEPAAAEEDTPRPAGSDEQVRTEVLRIFLTAVTGEQRQISDDDRRYLSRVVAQHTGLAPDEAERRVQQGFDRAKQAIETAEVTARSAADEARKVAAWSSLWMFVALLSGAFVASLAATFGGRQRDSL
jgi:hypothetical protein